MLIISLFLEESSSTTENQLPQHSLQLRENKNSRRNIHSLTDDSRPLIDSVSATMVALTLAVLFFRLSVFWTFFLIYDVLRRPNPPSFLSASRLLCHNIPALFLVGTAAKAEGADDAALVWFVALIIFRYWRTATQIWFWFRYKPAVAGATTKLTAADCTVVVPTVGPLGNAVYSEMVAAILVNGPARLIFSTNTNAAEEQVKAVVPAILAEVSAGTSAFQAQNNLGPMDVVTELVVLNANVSNKRQQVSRAFGNVETQILASVDDTAIWHPDFLKATLPAFDSDKVGFVGTRKWVKRVPCLQRFSKLRDPNTSLLATLWNTYRAGFWNCIGGLYLIRHNMCATSSSAADGGVFCVSGRSSFIRTEIVNNSNFTQAFLNEFVLRICDRFPGWGPVTADDDNFLTRWVINHGWDIKFQYWEEATMTTILGTYPLKFPDQCKRWSRTTFRQNPIALFIDRTIWWKWPLTVWITYFPWLYNAALFWDTLAVFTLTRSTLFSESVHQVRLLCCLVGFIWVSKLVKTLPWFWTHPADFFLYFVIPAYPLFAYWHSCLKVFTAFTFWDLEWSGRKLD